MGTDICYFHSFCMKTDNCALLKREITTVKHIILESKPEMYNWSIGFHGFPLQVFKTFETKSTLQQVNIQ